MGSPKPLTPRRRAARRAMALLITLWVVVVMSVIAYTTLFEANLNVELTRQARDRFYARMAARSGIGRAMVDLRNDLRIDRFVAQEEAPIDAKGDPWAETGKEYTDVPLGRAFFTVRVIDEESLLPFSSSRPEAMARLLGVLGMQRDDEASRVAAAIVDYIDFDSTPRFDNAPDSGEDRAYAALIVEDRRLRRDARVSYRNKNDNIIRLDELLDVYGVSPALYYGSEAGAEEDPRLRWRAPRYFRRFDFERDYRPGLRELLSVVNPGRVNINTARPEVLHALFAVAEAIGLRGGEDAANEIVSRRPEPRGTGRVDNSKAFRTPIELREAGVDQQALSAASSIVVFSVTSNLFRITSTGRSGTASVRLEATLRRDWDAFERDDSKVERGARTGSPRRGRDGDQQIEEPALRVLQWLER